MVKKFIKKPIVLVAIFIAIVFLPSGLASPPEGLDFLHATSVGLDITEEGEVEVSILAFVISPSKNYTETFYFLSAKAENPAKAVDLIGASVGKRVVLAHAGVVVIGNKLAESGVIEELNYLYRSHTIANDVFLMTANVSARELLQEEQKLISDAGIRLEEIGVYDYKNFFFNDINLEAFYKGYFSEGKSSITAYIELLPEDEAIQKSGTAEESGGSGGGNSGGDGSSSGGAMSSAEGENNQNAPPAKRYIQNLTRACVYHRGVLKVVLSEEETEGLNWTSPNLQYTNITIKEISDENFSSADLVFKVEGIEVKKHGYFVNGEPVIDYSVLLFVDIEEVLEQLENMEERIASGKTYLTKVVAEKIEAQVKKDFAEGLRVLVNNQVDVLDAFKTLGLNHYIQAKKWYQSLSDDEKQDFLRFIDFRMTVNVKTSR